jgi:hypothetical protein
MVKLVFAYFLGAINAASIVLILVLPYIAEDITTSQYRTLVYISSIGALNILGALILFVNELRSSK